MRYVITGEPEPQSDLTDEEVDAVFDRDHLAEALREVGRL